MKFLQTLKKDYKKINIIIFCILIYILFIPVVSGVLEKISPVLTECPYLTITGKPCPLCGGTRFIKNIGNVFYDISYIFNFFGIVFLIIIFELIFRLVNIFKKKYSDKLIKTDIILHIFLFISCTIYEICFIIIL